MNYTQSNLNCAAQVALAPKTTHHPSSPNPNPIQTQNQPFNQFLPQNSMISIYPDPSTI